MKANHSGRARHDRKLASKIARTALSGKNKLRVIKVEDGYRLGLTNERFVSGVPFGKSYDKQGDCVAAGVERFAVKPTRLLTSKS